MNGLKISPIDIIKAFDDISEDDIWEMSATEQQEYYKLCELRRLISEKKYLEGRILEKIDLYDSRSEYGKSVSDNDIRSLRNHLAIVETMIEAMQNIKIY